MNFTADALIQVYEAELSRLSTEVLFLKAQLKQVEINKEAAEKEVPEATE
ncbi:hypothetical protein NX029_26435 [Cytobacillus firmus]|nr:hypothetical protein [Cytobacillus firmus]